MENSKKLLVVEDEEHMRELLKYNLSKQKYDVETAKDGREGLEKVKKRMPDLIISDVMMPRMDGYEFCKALRRDPDMQYVPFIFLTAKGQLPEKVEGLRTGADDYLTKPFDPRELVEMVNARLSRVEVYKKMADYDEFTGLFNHTAIEEQLNAELKKAGDIHGETSIGFIDIDSFGKINDKFGHPFGNRVLRKVAEVLKSSEGEGGVVGRWGGEEFVVIYPCRRKEESFEKLEEIRRKISSLNFGESGINVTVSIGVASFPGDAASSEELIVKADKAMFMAKDAGRNRTEKFPGNGG